MFEEITWKDFEKVELRVGTVLRVEPFPEARKPAYKVWADFGPEIGERKSSAQITDRYALESLVGKQVLGVVNFPVKQIGPFRSEFLLCGVHAADEEVVLVSPDSPVPNGSKLM
ncbi:MAG: tRNA-binding protein [Bdellovibrionales bacterium]|nr:tRNA-binding protein [Bdellovibrionales bacterium]